MGLEMINAIRKEKGLSIDELSLKSGVPKSTLAQITAGFTKNPRVQTVQAIANALDCSIDLFSDYPHAQEYSIDEISILEKYRQLDGYGKSLLSVVADHEIERRLSSERAVDDSKA